MPFWKLIKEYRGWTITVVMLGIATNVLALLVPRLSASVIDIATKDFGIKGDVLTEVIILSGVAILSFIIALIQIFVSGIFSEKVAYKLRKDVLSRIGDQTYGFIASQTPGRLLTLITSDADAVKAVISQGLVTLLGAFVTLVGAAIMLLTINLRLGLYTISIIPLLILAMVFIFGTLTKLFNETQENVEKINAVINESIVASALVRVLQAAKSEVKKFAEINALARDTGLGIVKSISALIPIVVLLANTTTLIIIWFGGQRVIEGTLTIGNFSAFLSYTTMFIWPLFVLSFVGTSISRGGVSLKRINEVLDAPIESDQGTYDGELIGDIEFKKVSLIYKDESGNDRSILQDISFTIKHGTKNAIIGPTGAGKTQLFYLLAGLVKPTEGTILIDSRPLAEFKSEAFLARVGLVFQDSIVFNSSFRENISLSDEKKLASDNGEKSAARDPVKNDARNAAKYIAKDNVKNENVLDKALETAELKDFIEGLPRGLDTHVSERGTSLSGGQKQRLMLARALAINPKILLLDDFTARVDRATEASILENVSKNYPDVTLVSITQKIEPIQNYDHIIVIMEGELVAEGKHADLITDSFEYKQIYESQQSTENTGQKQDDQSTGSKSAK